MRFRHVLPTLALAVAALIIACGDDDVGTSSSSSGSGGTSSGGSSTSSGVGTSSSSSSGYPGIENVIAIKVTSDWCYRPANQCLDAQTFLVDFTSMTVVISTCIEVAGAPDAGPADGGVDGGTDFGGGTRASSTSHAITAESVTKLKSLLNAMQTTQSGSYDAGAYVTPLKAIEVTSKLPSGIGGVSYLTPDTTCLGYPTVLSGWDAIYDAVRAL